MSQSRSQISTDFRRGGGTNDLREVMEAEGIFTRDPLISDGRLHRIHVEGDRRGSRNGWYVLHADPIASGAFGSWQLGITKTWHCAELRHAGVEARSVLQELLSEAERQRHVEETLSRERARSKAEKIWARAKPAPADHPYLTRKQVRSHELRASCGRLLVPLYDAGGVLRSLQFIAGDGTKLFLARGVVRGCFYLMGVPNGKLFLAEGYATAATIREATKEAVAVAFNASNLVQVAKALRQKFENLPIVIAADNDHSTDGNPGMAKALEAARAVGAKIAVPHFHDTHSRGTDFNDLANREGQEETKFQLSHAMEVSEAALQYAESVIEALSASPSASEIEIVVAAIANTEGLDRQEFLATSLSKKLGGQTTLGGIRAAVRDRAAEIDRQHAAASESVRIAHLRALKIEPAVLIEELKQFFNQRMQLRAGADLILALYALNTWCFDLFETVAYLLVSSPLPQCGKTRLLALLEVVCARARSWVSVSGASMFRTVELHKPTLLIDQVEKLAAFDETSRDIIAILEAGYKKGARVPRMTGKNHDTLREFSSHCPKVLACVGKLRGALLDRCIVIELERKPPGFKLKSARTKALASLAGKLREDCEAYSVQHRDELLRLYEEEPDEGYWPDLSDREQELFGPLLLHARVGGFEERAFNAALTFSGRKLDIQDQEQDFSLTRELCEVLEGSNCERFAPKMLLPELLKKEVWGSRLAVAQNDRAAATVIGCFLARFHLESRLHSVSGTTYERGEAIKKISSYIAGVCVKGVRNSLSYLKSEGYAADTTRKSSSLDNEGISSQACETERLHPRLTPLTARNGDSKV